MSWVNQNLIPRNLKLNGPERPVFLKLNLGSYQQSIFPSDEQKVKDTGLKEGKKKNADSKEMGNRKASSCFKSQVLDHSLDILVLSFSEAISIPLLF